jgi:rhodanese-related sulfurtransferase
MNTETIDGATLENWGAQELYDAHRRGEVVIIDVRTPQEYAFEHIHGALLAPMATFEPGNLPSQAGKPIVFHCGSGKRSHRVAESCIAAGFSKIAHLAGGFAAWKQAGLPYVAIDPANGSQRVVGSAS